VEANKLAFEEGLKKVESYLGQDYPLIIGGFTETILSSVVIFSPPIING
jgi:1-pyrroline-5-carboxylate dehydrogenase